MNAGEVHAPNVWCDGGTSCPGHARYPVDAEQQRVGQETDQRLTTARELVLLLRAHAIWGGPKARERGFNIAGADLLTAAADEIEKLAAALGESS